MGKMTHRGPSTQVINSILGRETNQNKVRHNKTKTHKIEDDCAIVGVKTGTEMFTYADHVAHTAALVQALELCAHKIEQHLGGQYPDGAALRAALTHIRAALDGQP